MHESSYPIERGSSRVIHTEPSYPTLRARSVERVASARPIVVRDLSPRRSFTRHPDTYTTTVHERALVPRSVVSHGKGVMRYDYRAIMDELSREQPVGYYYEDKDELLMHAMDVLRTERKDHDFEVAKLLSQLDAYKALFADGEADCWQKEQLVKMVEVRGTDIKCLKSDNEALMEENENLRRAYAKLKEKYRVLVEEFKSLRPELLQLRTENARLRAEFEAMLAKQEGHFQHQLSLLQEENRCLIEELDQLRAEHSRCGPEMDSLRYRIAELEAEIARLRSMPPKVVEKVVTVEKVVKVPVHTEVAPVLEEVEEW